MSLSSQKKQAPLLCRKTQPVLKGLPDEFRNASLADIKGKPKSFTNAIKGYAEEPDGFLLISGTPGTGKTFLAAAVMKAIELRGRSSYYTEAMKLYQDWLSVASNYLDFLYRLQEFPFLVIDDFGHRSSSEAYSDFLHMLFSRRKSDNRATMVITTLNSKQIQPNITPAIFSRITSGMILKLDGKDNRKSF